MAWCPCRTWLHTGQNVLAQEWRHRVKLKCLIMNFFVCCEVFFFMEYELLSFGAIIILSRLVQWTNRGWKHTHTYTQCATDRAEAAYPTVSLQSLHEVVVGLCVKVESLFVHVLKVQILVSGTGLLSFFPGCPSLVGGSLQVVLVVHFDRAWQDVVHHHQSDVDAPWLDAVQPVELGQQRAWILV